MTRGRVGRTAKSARRGSARLRSRVRRYVRYRRLQQLEVGAQQVDPFSVSGGCRRRNLEAEVAQCRCRERSAYRSNQFPRREEACGSLGGEGRGAPVGDRHVLIAPAGPVCSVDGETPEKITPANAGAANSM